MNISLVIKKKFFLVIFILFTAGCNLINPFAPRPTISASTATNLPPMEIFITLENNPDAIHVERIPENQVPQIHFWVRGQGKYQIPFTLILTMPDGGRLQYGADSQTDINGQPVPVGVAMTLKLKPGKYRLEVMLAGHETANSVFEFFVVK